MGELVKEKAVDKLQEEMKNAKDTMFAEPILSYLIKRCGEDAGLSEDVLQEHKTWKKCFDYIYEQAKKLAKGQRQCAVRDDVVYEWAEDYYHKDDKAEEEEKARKEAERKKKEEERKAVQSKKTEDSITETEQKVQIPEFKPVKKKNECEGQIDFFALMGM